MIKKTALLLSFLNLSFTLFAQNSLNWQITIADITVVEQISNLNTTPPIDVGITEDDNIMLIYPKGYILLSNNVTIIPETFITLFYSSRLSHDFSITPAEFSIENGITGFSDDLNLYYSIDWKTSQISSIRMNFEGEYFTLFANDKMAYFDGTNNIWNLYSIHDNHFIQEKSFEAFFWIITSSDNNNIYWIDKLNSSLNSSEDGIIETEITNLGSSNSLAVWKNGFAISNNGLKFLNRSGEILYEIDYLYGNESTIYGEEYSPVLVEVDRDSGNIRVFNSLAEEYYEKDVTLSERNIIESLIDNSIATIDIVQPELRTEFIDWLRALVSKYRTIYPLNFELTDLERALLELR